MSRTVWKFSVPVDDQVHEMELPEGFVVSHVASQTSPQSVEFWALVDTDAPRVRRRFTVVGTGHRVPDEAVGVLGTALAPVPFMDLVWHVLDMGGAS